MPTHVKLVYEGLILPEFSFVFYTSFQVTAFYIAETNLTFFTGNINFSTLRRKLSMKNLNEQHHMKFNI